MLEAIVRGRVLAAVLSLSLSFSSAIAWPALAADAAGGEMTGNETVTMVGGISYVSGGVGEESREHLQALSSAFNLKLVLAMKSGAYLGDVQVSIADKSGKSLLQATADGPIFMAKLPPGSYAVSASADGVAQRQMVTVVKDKLGTLNFRW